MQPYPRLDVAYQTMIKRYHDARHRAHKLFIDEETIHIEFSKVCNEPVPSKQSNGDPPKSRVS